MRRRLLTSLGALAIATTVPIMRASVAAQTPTADKGKTTAAKVYTPPRTADGQPDLQGVWDFRNLILQPLERPAQFATKEFLTEQEGAEFEKQAIERLEQSGPFITDDPTFWWDYSKKFVGGRRRSSLIIDPPDGRIPPLTPEAKGRAALSGERRTRPAWGPEDRSVSERCILGSNAGPPMLPGLYNNNVQLFQTSGYVAILNEMTHNIRIVPLDGRTALRVPQWSGSSRGHWDGNTLVVETQGFRDSTSFQNSGPNMHLVETFARVDPNTLLYTFTVSDPTTWAKPFTVQFPMRKSDQLLYEYACHEGNYGMAALLRAARVAENATAEAAKGSK